MPILSMTRRLGCCLLLAHGLAPTDALSQSREALAGAARAFDESALRADDDNSKPMPVRKWTGPIRLTFVNANAASSSLVEESRRGVKTIAAETAITVVDVPNNDPTANFMIHFDENGTLGKPGYCFARAWWTKAVITKAELRLNPTRIRDFDRCAIHEPLHAFGFLSHPHAADSVLSYVQHGQRRLTALDGHLIHVLYDARLTPGLRPQPASQLACRLLGERLRSSAADIEVVCANRLGPAVVSSR
jgi:hypothetical protein